MLTKLRQFFASEDLQLELYLLATITGIAAGGAIVLFRLLIDQTQMAIFPSGEVEDFANIAWYWVIAMPVIGGLLVGWLFYGTEPQQRGTGVVHVMERLSYHEGRMPLSNFIRQFFGAAIALISGHSVGRESPSVHIGAANGSAIASNLDLPSNTTRILVASGAAAAIAASFDTPIAGVIFAMEVIMMEYYIASFIPIILASVSGAVIGRLVFEEPPFYGLVAGEMESLWELPYMIFLGLCLGLVAVAFIRSLAFFSEWQNQRPLWIRTTMAGLMVGLAGLIVPDVMGMSYNLLDTSYLSELALFTLVLILVLKLILSSACVGMGVPGGLIGPTLIMGATAGALLGHLGEMIMPELASSVGFYAMIGMCAMMAATLRAPLAAMMALLELTTNPHIILPGMLAIVFSSIVVFELFKLDSAFLVLLRKKGLDYRNSPLAQALRRISVTKAMKTEFIVSGPIISRQAAALALSDKPLWVVIESEEGTKRLMLAADLALAVNEDGEEDIDLLAIPASRRSLARISSHHSLEMATKQINDNDVEALYVTRRININEEIIIGVMTKEDIEARYLLAYNE